MGFPSIKFLVAEPLFMKLQIYIMLPEPVSTVTPSPETPGDGKRSRY
jgi:hypothetical protein